MTATPTDTVTATPTDTATIIPTAIPTDTVTATATSTPVDVPVVPGAGGPGGSLPMTLLAALVALAALLLWARRSPSA